MTHWTKLTKALVSIGLPLAAALLAGCTSKVSQCNSLIEPINKQETAMSSLSAVLDEKSFTDFMSKTDAAKKAVGGVELKDEKLKGFQAEYLKMMDDIQKAVKNRLDADKAHDTAKQLESASAGMAAQVQGKTLTDSINAYCQAP